jgi:hypothetical protein
MQRIKKNKFNNLIIVLIVLVSCGKPSSSASPDDSGTGGGTGGGTPGNNNKTCTITAISQVNSGSGAEFSLSAEYNSSYNVTKLIIYDSLNKVKNFEADFNYITKDSIKIDQYQYLILDTSGRVIRFATKSDMSAAKNADNYLFEYTYNAQGYLVTKNLFINSSELPNFSTAYNPLKEVTTKIYNPSTGVLLDTWTTTYGKYVIDTNGHILSGEANGDLQQGIASFYGKTNFYYSCH